MRIRVSRGTAMPIVLAVMVSFGLWFFLVPTRPKVAAAGQDIGIKAACSPAAGPAMPTFMTICKPPIRSPSPCARQAITIRHVPIRCSSSFLRPGYNRHGSENFYDLTTEATRRGFIVAYSNHLSLSPSAVLQQAQVAATVASFFCVDESSIAYLGHSDGGAMAEGIPAYVPKAAVVPRAIVASAAGMTTEDLAAMPCPSIPAVMIVHSRNDERFPNFGRGAAAYWGRCAACAPADLNASADGCHDFAGCAKGKRVTYCETSLPHKRWPGLTTAMLDFIQGGTAKLP